MAFCLMACAAVAENVRAGAALRTEEIAHVLHNAEHRHVHALEHGNAAPRINERQVLRRRDNHRALERHLLCHGELRIPGARRHVHNHDVELAPFHLTQHLGECRNDHRAAPDHRRLFVDQKTDRHGGKAIAGDWFEPRASHGLRPFADGEQLGQRRSINVGVENADLHAERGQPERQIDRGRRFADAPLAGCNRNDGLDAGHALNRFTARRPPRGRLRLWWTWAACPGFALGRQCNER